MIIGCLNLYFASKFLVDPIFTDNYIKKSPKALIWRKIFGEDKAIHLAKTIFAPLGVILGSLFILAGVLITYI
jgi:hypothetical protein